MLVLTRRPGESIIIGKHLVKIKVLSSSGQSVRIGIEAPKELSVHREEIYHCIVNGTLRKPDANEPVARAVEQPEDLSIEMIDDNEERGNK